MWWGWYFRVYIVVHLLRGNPPCMARRAAVRPPSSTHRAAAMPPATRTTLSHEGGGLAFGYNSCWGGPAQGRGGVQAQATPSGGGSYDPLASPPPLVRSHCAPMAQTCASPTHSHPEQRIGQLWWKLGQRRCRMGMRPSQRWEECSL